MTVPDTTVNTTVTPYRYPRWSLVIAPTPPMIITMVIVSAHKLLHCAAMYCAASCSIGALATSTHADHTTRHNPCSVKVSEP